MNRRCKRKKSIFFSSAFIAMSTLDVIQIFSHPPPPPCSHTLRIDAHSTVGIFKALVVILKAGMAVLYASNGVVDLSKISDEDIERVQDYFRAFCIEMRFEILQSLPQRRAGGSQLSDYSLIVCLPSHVIRISFDYMTPDIRPPRFF